MKHLVSRSCLAVMALFLAPRCSDSHPTERKPCSSPEPRKDMPRNEPVVKVLRKGLGPRQPLSAPLPAQAYRFHLTMAWNRHGRKSRILLQGAMEQVPSQKAGPGGFVVAKLEKVRPSSLSPLLLKRVVGRPLSSLPGAKAGIQRPDAPPLLPQVPLGPGARWKVTRWQFGPKKTGAIRVETDCRMERTPGRILIRETSVLACPKNAPVPCRGRGRATWDIRHGNTLAVHSELELEIGTEPGAVTETQSFDATALPRPGALTEGSRWKTKKP